jgi:trk system potassium uptake protein TrkA
MRHVIAGCGRVGAALASRLALDGHDVAVIDRDPRALGRLGPTFTGRSIEAMALDKDALLEAGIEHADALAAVTGSDEVNAVLSRAAKRLFRVPRVVARMYEPRTAEVYRRLGVQTISPVAWAVSRLTELMVLVDVAAVTTLGAGQVDLVEAVAPPLLDNRPIGELEIPGEVRAASVTRAGRTFVPDAATRLHRGDIVSLAVAGGSAERLERLLGRHMS